jgi:bromodomain-containing protein 7/9
MRQDGSLDYTQSVYLYVQIVVIDINSAFPVEDPFAVLSVFAQEPPSRPYVTSLFHPLVNPTPSTQLQPQYDPTTLRSQSLPLQLPTPLLTSINLPLDYSPPDLVVPVAEAAGPSGRRHWVITRNLTRRGKEKDDEHELPEVLDLRPVREVHAVDFGSFAQLAGALEEEMRQRGILVQDGDDEVKILDSLRESVVCETTATGDHQLGLMESAGSGVTDYWTSQRAAAAEEYIRDLVYGGVDGLAYTRSLAEFVTVAQQPVSLVLSYGLQVGLNFMIGHVPGT